MTMSHFYALPRERWRSAYEKLPIKITPEQLRAITSLNDRVSLQDVEDIYAPLIHVIGHHLNYAHELQRDLQQDFGLERPRIAPFIIGISGSVSVGKSTTARLLQMMLAQRYPDYQVDLMTTDGFLYPNAVLQEKGMMSRKGFPESYDMPKLLAVLEAVKTGENAVQFPVYSHTIYDIIPDQQQTIDCPDILIVEGINVLQIHSNGGPLYVSDFFDFSIYVDAAPEHIEQWYLERFAMHLSLAKDKPDNYYYRYANGDYDEAINMAKSVWQTVNLVNLRDYILPTRTRADVVLHKTTDHYIDAVYLRKY